MRYAEGVLRLLQRLIQLEWPVRLANPIFGPFNPFLPEFRRNPYPYLHRLRAHEPVYFSRVFQGWVLTRYADIVAVLQSSNFSVERERSKLFQRLNPLRGLDPDFAQAVTRNLLMLDPPDHTRLRGLVNKAFTPRTVEKLRPRIQQIVDELLDEMSAQREIDLIQSFAYPLPVIVIAEMLGVRAADRARFKRWSDDLAALLDPLQAVDGMGPAQQAFFEVRSYFREVIEERRREPRDDLVSALANVEERGQSLHETELISLAMLLLGAGNETTTNLIGNAFVALLQNPEQRRRLAADPALFRTAIDEFLRYDSPVQATDRVALNDCEIAGKRVRKGQLVGLWLAAANRDPAQFPDPDRLDVGRTANQHLSFGYGAHFCLGAALARVEGEIAIASFLRRFAEFDGETDGLQWKRSMILRGPTSLKMRVSSALAAPRALP